jgi:hypothetical protein
MPEEGHVRDPSMHGVFPVVLIVVAVLSHLEVIPEVPRILHVPKIT